MANTLGLVGVVLSGLAFVLGVVGMAIPYWIYASVNGIVQSQGLWQICVPITSFGGSTCISFPVGMYFQLSSFVSKEVKEFQRVLQIRRVTNNLGTISHI